MKTTFLKITALAAALLALGMVCILGVHAQQPTGKPGSSLLTTNWIGNLVVGNNETFDQITRGLSPTAIRQVEVGLRSDGVMVWRTAANKK